MSINNSYKFSKNDQEWIDSHLNKVSRTFALSIKYLPQPYRYYTGLHYLICRIPDTIEDSKHIEPKVKKELLYDYIKILNNNYNTDTTEFLSKINKVKKDNNDWDLVLDIDKTINLLNNIPREYKNHIIAWSIELTYGMSKYVTRDNNISGIRIKSVDDLDKYCYYVAGTVGHTIVDLIITKNNITSENTINNLHKNAENYGLFLQYINILKDIYEDYEKENSIYIPQSILKSYDIKQEDILLSSNQPMVKECMLQLILQLERYEDGANKFINQLEEIEPSCKKGWSIPYLLGISTFREIQNNIDELLTSEDIKITKEEVNYILNTIEKDNFDVNEFRSELLSNYI